MKKTYPIETKKKFDNHDHNLAAGAAGGDHLLQSLPTSLRNGFRFESLPSALVYTIIAAYRQQRAASIQALHNL